MQTKLYILNPFLIQSISTSQYLGDKSHKFVYKFVSQVRLQFNLRTVSAVRLHTTFVL